MIITIITAIMVIIDVIGYVYLRDLQLRIKQLEHENKQMLELINTINRTTLNGMRSKHDPVKTLLKD